MKITYVVSSLKRTGPTQQLLNIIRFLKSCDVTIITLSLEPTDSLLKEFENIGTKIIQLNLSRLASFFIAKKALQRRINAIKPSIVHTQGIRADRLLSSMDNRRYFWVSTIRNVPTNDYPAKYGRLLGRLMAIDHVSSLKKCSYLVSCSVSVKNSIKRLGLSSIAIRNGVYIPDEQHVENISVSNYPKPVFVSVGNLISRKNVSETISAFKTYKERFQGTGTLLIVGDGPKRTELESRSIDDVVFLGHRTEITQILTSSNYFISSSLSEGLPNTVLEAMSCGLPAILSDIPSHREIFLEADQSVRLYNSENSVNHLAELMNAVEEVFDARSGPMSRKVVLRQFSAQKMSQSYENFYKEIWTNASI